MLTALIRSSKSRAELLSEAGDRMRQARKRAGHDTLSSGAEALGEAGLEMTAGKLGAYERGETAPQIDVLLDVCETFDVSPLYVLMGLGPFRLSDIEGMEGRFVAEAAASYAGNGVSSGLVQVPVTKDEAGALSFIAKVRDTTTAQLLRELIDLPAVLAEEGRIRAAVDRYDRRTGED